MLQPRRSYGPTRPVKLTTGHLPEQYLPRIARPDARLKINRD